MERPCTHGTEERWCDMLRDAFIAQSFFEKGQQPLAVSTAAPQGEAVDALIAQIAAAADLWCYEYEYAISKPHLRLNCGLF